MNEEIRRRAAHRIVDPDPTQVRVDAPALPRHVGGPEEAEIAPAARRLDEAAADWPAAAPQIAEIQKAHFVEDPLPGWQAGQVDLADEVPVLERIDDRRRHGAG